MSNRSGKGPSAGIAPSGFRLPAGIELGGVRLQISDLRRSLAFYQRVLGLVPVREGEGEVALGAPGADEVLITLHERPGAAPVPPRGRLGLYHFALLLPDRRSLGRFAAHLRHLHLPFGASDHRVSEALYLQDPDGLGIEVYADRPRESWEYQGQEIVMATEPLPIHELIRASGEGEWSGMPADTRVGHLHLHVGSLAAAEAFYHDALGFDKVVWSYPGALFLSAGGYHHHLGVNSWAAGAPPPGEDDARLLEWEVRLPTARDAEEALASIFSAGFPVERTPEGGIIHDPWGTALRVRAVRTD